jgi:hypothetical protein
LAIADLAGGEWPQLARQAGLMLSGEAHDGAVGVELLKDIRLAFGNDEVIRSTDLVAKLTADPERPWADWKHGRPLAQRQLASLLAPFHVISTTVHPPGGLPHGKGYRRADFEEAWKAYCPGQNHALPPSGSFETCERASAEEMGATHDFRSVREKIPHGSKKGNLSHGHAGLHACTDPKAENGTKGRIDHETASYDRRCDYCGSQLGGTNPWDWPPDRPTRQIWLHPCCEEPWADCGGLPEDVR